MLKTSIPLLASPAQTPKKRDELTFDDDEDDLMDALGFGESPKESPKQKETVLIRKNERYASAPVTLHH